MVKMIKIIISLFLLIPFTSFSNSGKPLGSPNGRMYAPEEGTFDRRKRIVIHNICRLVKEEHVPGEVECEYVTQKKGEKNKQIFLGAQGNVCQKQITCPVK